MSNSKTPNITATNTEQQILEAAYRCLAQNGSANVSTRDIARESGVTLSLIHYYFPNKEELLVAAASEAISREIAALQEEVSPFINLEDRGIACIRFIRRRFEYEDTKWRKVYFDLLSQAAWSDKIAQQVRRLQDSLVSTIIVGLNETQSDLNLNAFSRLFLAALNGLALQFLHHAPKNELDDAYAFLETTLCSLLQNKKP